MKMIMVVVPADAADRVLDALINAGLTATYTETHGGMLRQTQCSLFIAARAEQLQLVLDTVRDHCHTRVEMHPHGAGEQLDADEAPVTAELGGAIAFVWDLTQIETF